MVGTYGRGFWIFDDLAPLQQLTPEVMASGSHLFAPRDAYRFRPITPPSVPYDDPTVGRDPEYGAYINYWLAAAASETPTVEIVDGMGAVVRTIDGTNSEGVNRIHWDLRDEPNGPISLYTRPMYAEHIAVGEEGRPAGGAQISILMPPGQYTVRLNVDGESHEQPLTVIKDPHSAGSEADIAQQIAFLKDVRADVVAAGEAMHRVEALRVQLQTMARFAEDETLSGAISDLEGKLEELQGTLVDLRQTGQGQDAVRFAARLLSKLGYLTNALSVADFPPRETDPHIDTANEHVNNAETQRREHTEAARAVCVTHFEPVDDPQAWRTDMALAVQRADNDHRQACKQRQDMADLKAEVEALRVEQSVASELGRLLRADGFERWLLAEAVGDLVIRASERLLALSNGQFSFDPDGTDFDICDHHNADQVRQAKSLSGGETFLASLALALALSDSHADLAPEGAPGLDSLFLDEGFGTLDPETLDVTAAAIEELGASGRMVAIVTHIRELAERMPLRFEVTKIPHNLHRHPSDRLIA